MKPITCTTNKNDITVSRSFSREAAMQYERMTEIFAAMKNFHELIIGVYMMNNLIQLRLLIYLQTESTSHCQ